MRRQTFIVRGLLAGFLICLVAPSAAQEAYLRLKGYWRTTLLTDSVLTTVVDGMVEFYVPLTPHGELADRKLLGQRVRHAGSDGTLSPDGTRPGVGPWAADNETLLGLALPQIEVTPLIASIGDETYSLRNNGDVFFLDQRAGHIACNDSTVTISMDELAGRPAHELDMAQLRLYGYAAATLTQYDERECYSHLGDSHSTPTQLAEALAAQMPAQTYRRLLSTSRTMTLSYRRSGDEQEHVAQLTGELYVTDRMTVTRQEKRKLMKQKNNIRQFTVPGGMEIKTTGKGN